MIHKSQEKGFTLLEVLFALTIFTIGMLGVMSSLFAVIKSNQTSRNFTIGVKLAQNKIDDLRQTARTNYSGITTSSESDLSETESPGSGIFDRDVSVDTYTSPNYKVVTVIVTWSDIRNRSVQIPTIIAE